MMLIQTVSPTRDVNSPSVYKVLSFHLKYRAIPVVLMFLCGGAVGIARISIHMDLCITGLLIAYCWDIGYRAIWLLTDHRVAER